MLPTVIVMSSATINSMKQYMDQFAPPEIEHFAPPGHRNGRKMIILYEIRDLWPNGEPKLHSIAECPIQLGIKSPRECINDINQALSRRISSARH